MLASDIYLFKRFNITPFPKLQEANIFIFKTTIIKHHKYIKTKQSSIKFQMGSSAYPINQYSSTEQETKKNKSKPPNKTGKATVKQ